MMHDSADGSFAKSIRFVKWSVSLVFIVLLTLSQFAAAQGVNFTDNFEGSTLNGFWTPEGSGGSVSLSSAQSHKGSQSLQLSETQWCCFARSDVTHYFAALGYGSVSVWVYHAGGQFPLFNFYAGTGGSSWFVHTPGFSIAIDGSFEVFNPAIGQWIGGVYPASIGWHHLQMNITPAKATMMIDGTTVLTQSGNYPFSQVTLDTVYPGSTYFDDFSVNFCPVGSSFCSCIINGALNVQPSGRNICATFTPNFGYTLQQAAALCGFQNFDWVQHIVKVFDPQAFCARNIDGAFDPSATFDIGGYCELQGAFDHLSSAPVRLTSHTTPYSDSPQGGGYVWPSGPYSLPQYSYPFYYESSAAVLRHENGISETECTLPVSPSGYTLTFHDAPGDPCMLGGSWAGTNACDGKSQPNGSYVGFITDLVGVNASTARPLGIAFSWYSTYNGTSGGAYTIQTDLPADNNGTGGITVTNVNQFTTYQTPTSGSPSPLTLLTGTQISPTASGLAYSRVSKTFNGTVTITNISNSTITGPFQIVFNSLTTGVTLTNATSTFGGFPYLTVPNASSLAPGQSATVSVQFSNPSNAKINLIPLTYSGSFN